MKRVFLDTVFIQALLNRRDKYHSWALDLLPQIEKAQEVWITEAVLTEVCNALSASNRGGAIAFCRQCYSTPNMRVVPVDSELMQIAYSFYEKHVDKDWGLTDCISFVVMQTANITVAVTADHHFTQAGFQILKN